jgi:hypothetical protein
MSSLNDVAVYLLVLSVCSQATGSSTGTVLVVFAHGPFAYAADRGAIPARFSRIAAKFVLITLDTHDHALTSGLFRPGRIIAELV